MLKTKLFRGFAVLIVLFSLLSAVVGVFAHSAVVLWRRPRPACGWT